MLIEQNDTPLAEMMKTVVQRSKADAGAAIEGLATIADGLEMEETAVKLRETARNLESDTFNIIVIGRFKNGKSTLLNALLGGTDKPVDLSGHEGPMVVDDLPATATLTWVRYADEPYVKVWGLDGKSDQWPLHRYLSESILDIDEEESQRRFQNVSGFEMGFPANLCKAGVTLYDSPGLDEHAMRTNITKEASKRCDAAIVVYRSDVLMGQAEMMDAANLIADGTRVFTVVNLWNGRKVDDRVKGYVWNRYVRDHLGGPTWSGQDPSSRDLYLLDANAARVARYEGDQERLEESGLEVFERRLADFLLRERYQSHLRKFSSQAESLASAIDQHIAQRRMATRADQKRLREAYEEILPQLTEIRRRPTKLTGIVHRHRDAAVGALTTSFISTIAKLRDELPRQLESAELRHIHPVAGVFQQSKLAKEVSELVNTFVSDTLNGWEEQAGDSVLQPILRQLTDDIATEIADIGRQFDRINFELTGWEVEARSGSVVGTTERILSATGSFFVGGIGGAVAGGAGGWRGGVGSAAGAIGATLVMMVLGLNPIGLTAMTAAIAASIAAGAVAGSHGLQKRVTTRAMKDVDPTLRDMPEQMAPQIERALFQSFEQIEKMIAKEIASLIDEEGRNIMEIVNLNQSDQAERERVLATLDEASTRVGERRDALRESI